MNTEFNNKDLDQKLDLMAEELVKISNHYVFDFANIFSNSFMMHYTNTSSIELFLLNSPHKIKSQEEFKQLPTETMDNYVFENTPFNNWKDMHQKAVKIYLAKRLGL